MWAGNKPAVTLTTAKAIATTVRQSMRIFKRSFDTLLVPLYSIVMHASKSVALFGFITDIHVYTYG